MQPAPNPLTSTTGLTSEEARRRLVEFGANDPVPRKRTKAISQLLSSFLNPLIPILVIASIVSAALGEVINATIIIVMVSLSVLLNFIQSYRSQQAAERLRREVAPTAMALRDGVWQEVSRGEIVPGDLIQLTAGDLVPADGWIVIAQNLHVQEAALTGESLPVEKLPADTDTQLLKGEVAERNRVFLGTSVVSGMATVSVKATGAATAFGDIAARLATRPPQTEFERGMRKFGVLIMRTVVFLVLFVFLVRAVQHHDPLESLLFAIALAVGLTPEFLPMITTVTLSQGAAHMAREKVIVKHLEAVQNLGSIDVLCSDKTGTLTKGVMTLDQHLDALGRSSERAFLLLYLNSIFETGVNNPIDEAIKAKARGNPLDTAVLQHDHPDVEGYQKLYEIPFDFERRRISVVIEKAGAALLITKGAPESVLPQCSGYEKDGLRQPFDDQTFKVCEETYRALSAKGFRVLAIAFASLQSKNTYDIADEKEMTLAGFATFSDTPLIDAAAAIEDLRRDGVQVKILTGDNELVASHVCEQIGLGTDQIVLGDEIARMSDAALGNVAERSSVFARVSPAQKNRIIIALKNRGHVVGFLGDGINDAPSLHAADVGISVSNAVDVAKDAADIILIERSLRVLHSGIIEGRKAFGNVMKYLLMGTSSNFGNMFSMAAASLFLPFLPMLPTQILLNNFLYDLAQVTIPTDKVDKTFIHKPHRWNISVIRDFMLYVGPISSAFDFLTFFALLRVFQASEELFHTGWFVESLATQTLVIFVIRTAGSPLHSRPSMALAATTVLVVIIGAVLPFTALGRLLGFTAMPAAFFAFLVVATGSYLLLVQLVKRRVMHRLLR
jgi:Mg2+-importing ATPase